MSAEETPLRNGLALFLLVASPLCAFAQSPDLEATCQSVARGFFMTDKLPVGTIQSFPELKPPGVRMTYSTREGTAAADMTDIFSCEFDKADKPRHLVRFCVCQAHAIRRTRPMVIGSAVLTRPEFFSTGRKNSNAALGGT